MSRTSTELVIGREPDPHSNPCWHTPVAVLALAMAMSGLAACGSGSGNGGQAGSNTTSAAGGTASGASSSNPASTPGAANTTTTTSAGSTAPASGAASGLPEPAPGTPPAGATPQMLALGDSIFHGLTAGGLCQTCHGPDAKGTPLGPPLAGQHKWLTGDGSYSFIQQRIRTGMPNPTPPYSSPMLPMGGAQLTPQQIAAVGAYEYSISH